MVDLADSANAVTGTAMGALPWWKGAVIYQIYPRSFLDTNGDGIGDLKGILSGLDHIASLGVDGIWISPFFTSPMADYGYDVADFCGVDPIFGTLQDFDDVVEKAHRLGLKVIIDQVYSHTSDHHDWFIESRSSRDNPRADWYVWADPKADGSPPNNWQSVFGGPSWEWDARRGQYYFHNFLKEQPDLNLYNEEVQDALIAAGRFWLERGVDGFRLDALNFSMHDRSLRDNPPSGVSAHEATRPFDMQIHKYNMSQPEIVGFIEKFRAMLDAYPGTFTVAEVGGPNPIEEMKAFTTGDQRLNSAYNFDFLYAPNLNAPRVMQSANLWDQSADEGWPSWAFSNHDAPRAVTRWASPAHRDEMSRLYMMLLLTLRGNPIIYQGEELGLPQAHVPFSHLKDPEAIMNWPKTLGRDGARTPMPWQQAEKHAGFSSGEPWLPVDPEHAKLAVDQQQGNDSVLRFTKDALATRKRHDALLTGQMSFFDAGSNDILIIERKLQDQAVFALFNFGHAAMQIPSAPSLSGDVVLSSRPLKENPLSTKVLPPRSGVWVRAI
ncbi:MAG: alpha-amylase family glycosyl hydrolase [Hyphomonadaceae bacterium]|nr:alpha-amylase family glycosyl hydrolase [Hyphomonadaceae bacterium]